MKKLLFILLVSIGILAGQQVRTKRMIDIPTAFSMNQAELELGGRLYAIDGMGGEVNIGIFNDFFIGVSYGGTRIIGRDIPVWNGHPGVRLQYRFIPEDFYYPNISFGFDSQGYGVWIDPRYEVKSKGFFLVFSKNYFVSEGNLGTLGFHGGANYCVTEEAVKGDDNVNFFLGFDKSLVKDVTLLAEYDFGLNDNADESITRKRGYLNIGIRWSFNNELHLEFDMKDILRNLKGTDNLGRELRVIYNSSFFTK
jgi:hypothetical protein